jgi:3',5'-cyclic AMP phosphodiesterase CpdA/HEAT repeat protein
MANILHLSDLHFGTIKDARIWYGQLAEDLFRELHYVRLDAIVLSGDIANFSVESEYIAAKTFLGELCNEFKVDMRQVVLVPGNHDLNWTVSREAYREEQLSQGVSAIEPSHAYTEDGVYYIRDEVRYKQRFKYFSAFCETLTGAAYPIEYEKQYSLQHFPEFSLLVLGLNSAWDLDHHYTARVSINSVTLSNALTEIRRTPEFNKLLKIAVWHHPLDSPGDDRIKDRGFVEQLSKAGFRFVLHGHIHKAEKNLFQYDYSAEGRKLDIIGAGTFGAPTKELVPGYPWQYNLLRIDGNTLLVETRRREEPNGAWKPDARWTRKEGELPTPYYPIKIKTESTDLSSSDTEDSTEYDKHAALAAYVEKLLLDTRDADYRGLSRSNDPRSITTLPFDEVYVPPRLMPQGALVEGEAQQEQILQRIIAGTALTIEDRVHLEEEFSRLAVAQWKPIVKPGSGEISIGEALRQVHHAVVLGDPGVGKSALARYVTRTCAHGEQVMLERFGWSERLIPIVVRAADFADELGRQPNQTLAEFISILMMNMGGEVLRRAVNERLAQGFAIIIIEGIDEVPEYAHRIQVIRAADKLIRDFAANRFLITSRPSGYIRLAGIIAHYKLINFSYDQIRTYIKSWYYALERHGSDAAPDFERAGQETSEAFNEIASRQKLLEFSTNPLLLTLIILIRRQGIRLPTRRIQLYQLSVDLLMELWNYWRSGGLPGKGTLAGGLSTNQLIQVWAAVAEWAHRTRPAGVLHRAVLVHEITRIIGEKNLAGGSNVADVEAYLDAAARRAGILEERAPNLFSFWHPTFEEYLAAVELSTPPTTTLSRLLPLRSDPRWREVILLTVAYIGTVEHVEEIASEIIEALAEHEPDPVWEPLVHTFLRLAIACIADGPGVKREIIEHKIIRLADAIQRLPYKPLIQSFVGAIRMLWDLRLSAEAIEAISPLAFHPDEFVRRETARLFANVADTNHVAHEWCLVMFDDSYYEVKYLAALGLVKAGDHRYEVWRMLMSHGVILEISPELREYLAKSDEQAADALRQCLDSPYQDIRFRAARFLIAMDKVDEQVLATLIRSLAIEDVSDWEICERLLMNLIWRDNKVLGQVYEYLTDESDAVRLGVANFLYKHQRREDLVIEAISSCLTSEDLSVRWQASKLLWEHGLQTEEVKEATASCLEAESVTLRGAAAETLLKMNYAEERVVQSQLWCLKQSDPINSAKRLLKMSRERKKVLETLYDHLTDDDYLVRVEAARELIEQGEVNNTVLEALRSCLWSGRHHARFYAWWTFNELGMLDGVLEALVKKLAVEGPFWRPHAKDSIGTFVDRAKLNRAEVEKTMLPLLEDDDARVRCTAAELLLEWDYATEHSLEILVALIKQNSEEDLAVLRRMLRQQSLEVSDSTRLLHLVQVEDGDSPIKRGARALLYSWLWQKQSTGKVS